jgi:hypothetical protein
MKNAFSYTSQRTVLCLVAVMHVVIWGSVRCFPVVAGAT